MRNLRLIEHNRSVKVLDTDQMGSISCKYKHMFILASNAFGWEHVSVSIPSQERCPTWEEMCEVKDIFWTEDEVVVQYHPKKSDYVNKHPWCLHLWRKTGEDFECPQKMLIG